MFVKNGGTPMLSQTITNIQNNRQMSVTLNAKINAMLNSKHAFSLGDVNTKLKETFDVLAPALAVDQWKLPDGRDATEIKLQKIEDNLRSVGESVFDDDCKRAHLYFEVAYHAIFNLGLPVESAGETLKALHRGGCEADDMYDVLALRNMLKACEGVEDDDSPVYDFGVSAHLIGCVIAEFDDFDIESALSRGCIDAVQLAPESVFAGNGSWVDRCVRAMRDVARRTGHRPDDCADMVVGAVTHAAEAKGFLLSLPVAHALVGQLRPGGIHHGLTVHVAKAVRDRPKFAAAMTSRFPSWRSKTPLDVIDPLSDLTAFVSEFESLSHTELRLETPWHSSFEDLCRQQSTLGLAGHAIRTRMARGDDPSAIAADVALLINATKARGHFDANDDVDGVLFELAPLVHHPFLDDHELNTARIAANPSLWWLVADQCTKRFKYAALAIERGELSGAEEGTALRCDATVSKFRDAILKTKAAVSNYEAALGMVGDLSVVGVDPSGWTHREKLGLLDAVITAHPPKRVGEWDIALVACEIGCALFRSELEQDGDDVTAKQMDVFRKLLDICPSSGLLGQSSLFAAIGEHAWWEGELGGDDAGLRKKRGALFSALDRVIADERYHDDVKPLLDRIGRSFDFGSKGLMVLQLVDSMASATSTDWITQLFARVDEAANRVANKSDCVGDVYVLRSAGSAMALMSGNNKAREHIDDVHRRDWAELALVEDSDYERYDEREQLLDRCIAQLEERKRDLGLVMDGLKGNPVVFAVFRCEELARRDPPAAFQKLANFIRDLKRPEKPVDGFSSDEAVGEGGQTKTERYHAEYRNLRDSAYNAAIAVFGAASGCGFADDYLETIKNDILNAELEKIDLTTTEMSGLDLDPPVDPAPDGEDEAACVARIKNKQVEWMAANGRAEAKDDARSKRPRTE